MNEIYEMQVEDITDEFLVTKRFHNANDFAMFIEDEVKVNRLTHMETIIKYCNDNNIEPDAIKKLVNESLKERIKLNAQEAGLMRKVIALEF